MARKKRHRKSAKRVRAGKKAARTRRRNKAKRRKAHRKGRRGRRRKSHRKGRRGGRRRRAHAKSVLNKTQKSYLAGLRAKYAARWVPSSAVTAAPLPG